MTAAVVGGVPAAQGGRQVVGEHAARDVLGHGAARVEDLRVAEAVRGRSSRGISSRSSGRRKRAGPEAVRLEDGQHPRAPRPGPR